MKRTLHRSLLILLLLGLVLSKVQANGQPADLSVRTLVHLLGYIAQDYGEAVADGRVVSDEEYEEQHEFFQAAQSLNAGIVQTRSNPAIQANILLLGRLIVAKMDADSVAALARSIQSQVIGCCHLETAPAQSPDIHLGKQLFARNCAPCHGVEGGGDGPVAQGLTPKPANFHDEERMEDLSPFAAFNTIRVGVQGTSMPSFLSLTDREAWDLAFYVLSLRYDEGAGRQAHSGGEPDTLRPSNISLQLAASRSDKQLAGLLAGTVEQKSAVIAAIRLRSGNDSPMTPRQSVSARIIAGALVAILIVMAFVWAPIRSGMRASVKKLVAASSILTAFWR